MKERKIHKLTGPHFNYIHGDDNGKLTIRCICDCGCTDNSWEMNEHDIATGLSCHLSGKVKNIKIYVSNRILISKKTELENVKIYTSEYKYDTV